MTPQNFRCISICPLIFNPWLESRLKFLPSKNLKIIISLIFLLPFYLLKRGVRVCLRKLFKTLSSFLISKWDWEISAWFLFSKFVFSSISASWTSWMQHYVLIGAWWILADCTLKTDFTFFMQNLTGQLPAFFITLGLHNLFLKN